jgi:antitoxin VapB
MYIDDSEINIRIFAVALQIANPVVVKKIESLAALTGLSKTGAVEKAVDTLLRQQGAEEPNDLWRRFDAILAQIDRIPDAAEPIDPLEWDEHGLPK